MKEIQEIIDTAKSLAPVANATLLINSNIGKKLLGPTADYYGKLIAQSNNYIATNIGNVLHVAVEKLGKKINSRGTIPPRAIEKIMNQAVTAENDIVASYLGGVLASSKTTISRDDRGIVYANTIGRLSTYQLRAHYLFYKITKDLYNDLPINLGTEEGRSRLKIFIPEETFSKAMDFSKNESKNLKTIISHIFFGLSKEELIKNEFSFGSKERLSQDGFPSVKSRGLIFVPTIIGIELFLWGQGYGNVSAFDFLKKTISFPHNEGIIIQKGYTRVLEFDWSK